MLEISKLLVVGAVATLIQNIVMWIICVGLEIVLPKRAPIPLHVRMKGLTLSIIMVVCARVIGIGAGMLLGLVSLQHLFDLPQAPNSAFGQVLWVAGGTVLATLAFEFFYYWYHRAQHAIPILWRCHVVHHATEDISAANAYSHWTEEFWRTFFITIPLTLVMPGNVAAIAYWPLIMSLQSIFVHSQTRIHFGPFWRLVCDNRLHRIHHSREERHFDKNFGVFTPFWDWVFGTLYVPVKNEWPDTGCVDEPEMQGIRDYITRAFRPSPGAATASVAYDVTPSGIEVGIGRHGPV